MLHLIIKFLCDYPLSIFASQLFSICYFVWSLHKFLFCSFFYLDFDRNQQNDYFLRNLLVIHHPNLLGLDHCNPHSNLDHCEWVSNFLVRFILKPHHHYPMRINSFSSTPILGWDASTVIWGVIELVILFWWSSFREFQCVVRIYFVNALKFFFSPYIKY